MKWLDLSLRSHFIAITFLVVTLVNFVGSHFLCEHDFCIRKYLIGLWM